MEALLKRLRDRDIQLQLDSGRLKVNAPKGALDDGLRRELAESRDALIAWLGAGAEAGEPGTLRRISRDGALPVSSAQRRLWFLDRVDPGNANYNIGGGVRLSGPLDVAAMRRAIDHLIQRHEALRTRISERDGEPWLEVSPEAAAWTEIVDLSHLSGEASEAAARTLFDDHRNRAFDMAHGPLAAFLLIVLSENEHVLASSLHHVISDGWSMAIVMAELFALYRGEAHGTPAPPAPGLSYVDYAAWEQARLRSREFAADLDYWRRELAQAPAVLELPSDWPRPVKPSFRGGRLHCFIDSALIEAATRFAQQNGATLFMTLLAAWLVVMHRYSGQEDVLIGTPMANRDAPELEDLIGCFVNNVVIRGRLSDNPSLLEFLHQVRGATLSAFEHGHVPFDAVVDAVNPERSLSHAPLFQVLFSYMSFPINPQPPGDLAIELIELQPHGSRFDLSLDMGPDPFGTREGEFRVIYEYAVDLFDEQSVLRMHDHFVQMLAAFATDPSARVREVALPLSPSDRRLLTEINATAVEHDRALCVHHLFECQARAAPQRAAVISDDKVTSYAALDQAANRLARLLADRGVAAGDLVAFCLDRDENIPTAMAAILKAGAAYVPLDPSHPEDRLRYILADAGAACVVTLRRFASLFEGAAAQVLVLDEAGEALGAASAEPLEVEIRPEALAYAIYTSGSTGQPKGVEVEHRNLVAFLQAMRRTPGLGAEDVLLAVTTPAFDIAGLEMWLPLATGAKIVMASRADVLDGSALIALIARHGVTLMQATPATWRLMLEAGWSGDKDLTALCGGEALTPDLADALVDRAGAVWNMYGPTETTVWSTVDRISDGAAPITIGRPIANTRVHVLDPLGRPTPIGVAGELCISGEGVARGYRGRPELTAEKFASLRPLDAPREPAYRTGDVARFRSDGRLEYLGRRDQQVKLRGYRIELGEIEAVLGRLSAVKACAVIVSETLAGDRQLAAYVVPSAPGAFDAEAAKAALRAKVPEYMTPKLFTVLGALPLTPNGKIDRKALPRPAAPPSNASAADEALMSPAQRKVAAVWKQVLGVDRVALNENFFDMGGHSLLLVKLHALLKQTFDTDVALVELFQRTTVAAQADRLTSRPRLSGALQRGRGRAERQVHG